LVRDLFYLDYSQLVHSLLGVIWVETIKPFGLGFLFGGACSRCLL
jgi:hypothetical protein